MVWKKEIAIVGAGMAGLMTYVSEFLRNDGDMLQRLILLVAMSEYEWLL